MRADRRSKCVVCGVYVSCIVCGLLYGLGGCGFRCGWVLDLLLLECEGERCTEGVNDEIRRR